MYILYVIFIYIYIYTYIYIYINKHVGIGMYIIYNKAFISSRVMTIYFLFRNIVKNS